MEFPTPRGPVSSSLFELLRRPAADGSHGTTALAEQTAASLDRSGDVLADEDLQLALFSLYELHFDGPAGSDERWEWNPWLNATWQLLETAFERDLRAAVELPPLGAQTGDGVADVLIDLAGADTVHERIAGRDLAGGLFEAEPALLADIYFGATAAMALDTMSTARTRSAWESGSTSLLTPLPVEATHEGSEVR